MRDIVLLQCTECKNKNYSTRRKKKTAASGTEKLQLSKYCKHDRRHTKHKETKA